MIISPSILSADFANLERDIVKLKNLGITWFHIDVMDGHFVPNITVGVPVVKSLRKIEGIFLDTHLMITNPVKYIPEFAGAGSDLITFHFESDTENISKAIELTKGLGKKVGISIKPNTTPDVLFKYLDKIDLALVMTVEPGFGGQSFLEDCTYKIKILNDYKNKNNLDDLIIQVDGGINDKTAVLCKKFGANSLVAGNYLFNSDNIENSLMKISF